MCRYFNKWNREGREKYSRFGNTKSVLLPQNDKSNKRRILILSECEANKLWHIQKLNARLGSRRGEDLEEGGRIFYDRRSSAGTICQEIIYLLKQVILRKRDFSGHSQTIKLRSLHNNKFEWSNLIWQCWLELFSSKM